ncbi:MAG TPA: N-acetylglucosamine-6-phosphate deacetylase [Candidatus Binataceae bacterium]
MREVSGLIARPDGSVIEGRVSFDGRIERIEPLTTAGRDYLLPGLIDLQVNGSHGMDVMAASVDDLTDISRYLAREGVTAYLPTAITSSLENFVRIDSRVGQCREANRDACDIASIAGLHLEGPFISAQRLGVHPPLMLEPAGQSLERVLALEQLRLLTIAPELAGAIEAIRRADQRGVAVSIGHTEATLAQAQSAVGAGARMFTHVFNAMRPLHHRDPGVVTAALTPSPAFAAVIADGVHVHPQVLALVYRARGAAGMILTSDKVGANPGNGIVFNSATNGKRAAQTADGRLAGSLVPLLDGVRLMVAEVGASVGEAALMAATNPAQLLGMRERGRIEVGCRADLLVLDPGMNLKAVFIAGCELE